MNRQELDALIGLHFDDAADKVSEAGLEPDLCLKGEIRISLSLRGNVVKIVYDDKGNVISAETQASIDDKYR
jgi:hypothetical protein